MKTLFGSQPKQVPSERAGGFAALPPDLQNRYRRFLGAAQPLLDDPGQYFAPIGLTPGETAAGDIISSQLDPQQYRQSIESYMSPFRDIVTEDINRAFEGPQGALASQISEAGAFGGSRARQAQGDLERARLGAIARATSDQFGQAMAQRQQGLQNLLGFGGLQRGIDLAQRGALPAAVGAYGGAISPLLNVSTGTGQYMTQGDEGLVSKAGKIGGLISGIGGLFSDEDLKENIEHVGVKGGLNVYEFSYAGSSNRYRGVIAQEVREIYPDAVSTDKQGYMLVDYDKLPVQMEAL